MESTNFAQRYLPKYGRPHVGQIHSLPPAIVIDQSKPSGQVRSKVIVRILPGWIYSLSDCKKLGGVYRIIAALVVLIADKLHDESTSEAVFTQRFV